jgi:hypothetical protein
MNPILPPWEYIPDGEPRVFGERVYLFGSHDRAHGFVFCSEDYVCWSADLRDLREWRNEGVIYRKTQDPLNSSGHMVMYAPDVVQGVDGRFYLYYVLDKANVVSVAVSDSPAGAYEFYGYVAYEDGTRLGERTTDEPQFDPGLFVEGEKVFLYTGLGVLGDESRLGATVTELGADMLTITVPPAYIVPSWVNGKGTTFEGREFFEASSMRKIGGMYYFIYSNVNMRELCYATSRYPNRDFVFGGIIVDNGFGNNHGSIEKIGDSWYVFYHRHTNDTWFSRQAMAEKIEIIDGKIPQVERTSQGLRGKPMEARGKFPAVCACELSSKPAKITQEGITNEVAEACYIGDITDGTVIGFKYFSCEGVKKITLTTRAYGRGNFEVRTDLADAPLGVIPVVSANVWTEFSAEVEIPDGIHAIFLTYKGGGTPHLLSLEFVTAF